MKKLCVFFSCLLICLAFCGLCAHAEGDFEFDAQKAVITAYQGAGGDVVIPAEIDGVAVKVIGSDVFYNRGDVTSVIIPEGVISIAARAFYGCAGLSGIQLPKSLEAIADYAFFSCEKFTDILIPERVAFIGEHAFDYIFEIENLRFLGDLPHFGMSAIGEKRHFLTEIKVTVPSGLKAHYEAALGFTCEESNEAASEINWLATADEIEFDAATGTVLKYLGNRPRVDIPQNVGGVSVTAIGEKAFMHNDSIYLLRLPEGLKTIGEEAFFGTYIADVYLPESLETIGESAFEWGRLENLRIPEGITDIPKLAFKGNSFQRIYLPSTLAHIGEDAFASFSGMNYIYFNSRSVPDIEAGAFKGRHIENIDIRADATKKEAEAAREKLTAAGVDFSDLWRADIEDQPPYPLDGGATMAFDNSTHLITAYTGDQTELTPFWNWYVGEDLVASKGLGEGAFAGSSVTRFTVPRNDAFALIGPRAFENSALERIDLFDSVTEIGARAFAGCVGLKEIIIPDSVLVIGAEAFANCTGFEKVLLPATANIAPDALTGVPYEAVYVYADTTDEQLNALNTAFNRPINRPFLREGEHYNIITMPDSYTANAESDFLFDAEAGAITAYLGTNPDVVIPESIGGVPVQKIGMNAFSAYNFDTYDAKVYEWVRSVAIPVGVTEIGDNAFYGCTALERIDCYGELNRINLRAFEGCTALREVNLRNGVQFIDLYAFCLCESLKTIDLGPYLDTVGEGAFYASGLTSVVANMRIVGLQAFRDCKSLLEVHLPAKVEKVEAGAFTGSGLQALCIERFAPDLFTPNAGIFAETPDTAVVYVPTSVSDEDIAAFEKSLLGYYANGLAGHVEKRDCDGAKIEVPAIEQKAVPIPDATPVASTSEPTAPVPEAPPVMEASGGFADKTYVVVSAAAGGVALDASIIGRYDVVFMADGACRLTIGGVAMDGATWTDDGLNITVNYYGIPYVFERDGEGFTMNYFDAMLLTYMPE